LIADAQLLTAQALGEAFRWQLDFQVLDAHPVNGLDTIDAVLRQKPDVAIIDYWMPDIEGRATVGRILAKQPERRLILVSNFHGAGEINSALGAGAVGFFPRSSTLQEVAEGVRRAHAGESPVYPQELDRLLERLAGRLDQTDALRERLSGLTRRELEMLALLSLHLSAPEVAGKLSISVPTARAHIRNILRKTETSSIRDVVNMAIACGLIRP